MAIGSTSSRSPLSFHLPIQTPTQTAAGQSSRTKHPPAQEAAAQEIPHEDMKKTLKPLFEMISEIETDDGGKPAKLDIVSKKIARTYNASYPPPTKPLADSTLKNVLFGSCLRQPLIDALNTQYPLLISALLKKGKKPLQECEESLNRQKQAPISRLPSGISTSPTLGIEELGLTCPALLRRIKAWVAKKRKKDSGFKSPQFATINVIRKRMSRKSEFTPDEVRVLVEVFPELEKKIKALSHDEKMVHRNQTSNLPLYKWRPEGFESCLMEFFQREGITLEAAAKKFRKANKTDELQVSGRTNVLESDFQCSENERKAILAAYPNFRPHYVALIRKEILAQPDHYIKPYPDFDSENWPVPDSPALSQSNTKRRKSEADDPLETPEQGPAKRRRLDAGSASLGSSQATHLPHSLPAADGGKGYDMSPSLASSYQEIKGRGKTKDKVLLGTFHKDPGPFSGAPPLRMGYDSTLPSSFGPALPPPPPPLFVEGYESAFTAGFPLPRPMFQGQESNLPLGNTSFFPSTAALPPFTVRPPAQNNNLPSLSLFDFSFDFSIPPPQDMSLLPMERGMGAPSFVLPNQEIGGVEQLAEEWPPGYSDDDKATFRAIGESAEDAWKLWHLNNPPATR